MGRLNFLYLIKLKPLSLTIRIIGATASLIAWLMRSSAHLILIAECIGMVLWSAIDLGLWLSDRKAQKINILVALSGALIGIEYLGAWDTIDFLKGLGIGFFIAAGIDLIGVHH